MQETGPKKVVSGTLRKRLFLVLYHFVSQRPEIFHLVWTFFFFAWRVPLCFPSYPSRKGKSSLDKESDTSRHTTTTWQASWRIIQTAFLWRSESPLQLAVTDEQSVNKKRLEMASGIMLWLKGSSPTAASNMLDRYWKAAPRATTCVLLLLLCRSQRFSVKRVKSCWAVWICCWICLSAVDN